MIPQSFVQNLLARVDIVDVIDPHVPLKRAGVNLVACCPFHSEKTPSFSVSPTKQFYYCFGCGAHGSALGFVMEHLGLSFVDAVKELAGRVGMQVPEVKFDAREQESRERAVGLIPVLERAQQYFKAELKRSTKAIEYLKRRGVTGEIASRYGIGYAPDGWQSLRQAFENYDQQDLSQAGLVIDGEGGRRYDRFRDRVMFPILDAQGRVIAYGGRVLDGSEPKYLNSPETPLFEKGRELYGLFQARQAIRTTGRVVVVEGYMDVVALAQFGVQYAVATLGTATTATHVQKLLRVTDEVVFCFDGDAAGRRAAWRALENALGQIRDGKLIKFLFLPEGDDPDSFVRAHGPERFEALLAEQAQPLSAYVVRELSTRADLTTPEGKARFLQDAKPLLAQIAAPTLGLMLRKRIAELSGLTDTEASRELQARPQTNWRTRAPRSPVLQSPMRRVVELLAHRPNLVDMLRATPDIGVDDLSLAGVPALESGFLLALMTDAESATTRVSLGEAFRGSPYEALAQDVERSTFEWEARGLDEEGLKNELEGYLRALRDQVRRARQRRLMETLSERKWTEEEKALFRRLQQPVI